MFDSNIHDESHDCLWENFEAPITLIAFCSFISFTRENSWVQKLQLTKLHWLDKQKPISSIAFKQTPSRKGTSKRLAIPPWVKPYKTFAPNWRRTPLYIYICIQLHSAKEVLKFPAKSLSSWRRGGRLRIDISAEQRLAEDRQDTAFGLLACGRADVDEVVDAGGGGWCWNAVVSWKCYDDDSD